MDVTATEAKNRFGDICALAKTEPVFVRKSGKIDSVILSAKQFNNLKSANQSKDSAKKKLDFEKTHAKWFKEVNMRSKENGLWCDDLRVW